MKKKHLNLRSTIMRKMIAKPNILLQLFILVQLLLGQSASNPLPISTFLSTTKPNALNLANATPDASVTARFLHITDLHIDSSYKKGSDPAKYCHRKNKNDRSANTAGKVCLSLSFLIIISQSFPSSPISLLFHCSLSSFSYMFFCFKYALI
jgi:hypothetical protein